MSNYADFLRALSPAERLHNTAEEKHNNHKPQLADSPGTKSILQSQSVQARP